MSHLLATMIPVQCRSGTYLSWLLLCVSLLSTFLLDRCSSMGCIKKLAFVSSPSKHCIRDRQYPTFLSDSKFQLRTSFDDSNNMNKIANATYFIGERKLDYIGEGTLGDIMSYPSNRSANHSNALKEIDPETHWNDDHERAFSSSRSGLVTSAGGTLRASFGRRISSLSPLDRIALTANGNLQRIFSSYYDAPVHVIVRRCERRRSEGEALAVWDRIVDLAVHDQIFCTATSEVSVFSQSCLQLVESGNVGIGQLFRHLNRLPSFSLIDAGRSFEGGLWRKYKLSSIELSCMVHEVFIPNAWEIMEPQLQNKLT